MPSRLDRVVESEWKTRVIHRDVKPQNVLGTASANRRGVTTPRPSRLLWCAVDPSGRVDWRTIAGEAWNARLEAVAQADAIDWRQLRVAGWRVVRVRIVPEARPA